MTPNPASPVFRRGRSRRRCPRRPGRDAPHRDDTWPAPIDEICQPSRRSWRTDAAGLVAPSRSVRLPARGAGEQQRGSHYQYGCVRRERQELARREQRPPSAQPMNWSARARSAMSSWRWTSCSAGISWGRYAWDAGSAMASPTPSSTATVRTQPGVARSVAIRAASPSSRSARPWWAMAIAVLRSGGRSAPPRGRAPGVLGGLDGVIGSRRTSVVTLIARWGRAAMRIPSPGRGVDDQLLELRRPAFSVARSRGHGGVGALCSPCPTHRCRSPRCGPRAGTRQPAFVGEPDDRGLVHSAATSPAPTLPPARTRPGQLPGRRGR